MNDLYSSENNNNLQTIWNLKCFNSQKIIFFLQRLFKKKKKFLKQEVRIF